MQTTNTAELLRIRMPKTKDAGEQRAQLERERDRLNAYWQDPTIAFDSWTALNDRGQIARFRLEAGIAIDQVNVELCRLEVAAHRTRVAELEKRDDLGRHQERIAETYLAMQQAELALAAAKQDWLRARALADAEEGRLTETRRYLADAEARLHSWQRTLERDRAQLDDVRKQHGVAA